MNTPRRPTYDRWLAALERARSERIAVVGSRGHFAVVTSGDGRTNYLSDGTRCTCTAGQSGDTCCKHNAAVFLFNERVTATLAA